MPVFYHVDSERQLVIYATRGQCTGMELFVAEQEARKDPNRRPGMRILMDLQGAEEFDFSLEDLNRGVEMNSQLESSGWELEKTAVLIRSTHDEISAGLYDDLASPGVQLRMATFKTLEPALAWLGLPGQRDEVERLLEGLRGQPRSGGE